MPTKSQSRPIDVWGVEWSTGTEPLYLAYSETPNAVPLPNNHNWEGEETITYENSNRNHPNPCEHTCDFKATKSFAETGFTPGGLPDWDYSWKTTSPWIVDIHHARCVHWMPNSPWSVPRGQLLETDHSVDALMADAIARLHLGCRETIFALPRAIAELRDVPKTVRQLLKLANFWGSEVPWALEHGGRGIREALPRELRNASPGKVRSYLATKSVADVAGAYLATVFGVRPTRGDVKTFLGRPENGKQPLKLAVTQPKLYKGQKLECAFKTLPPSTLFPTLETISLTYYQELFRDFHSSNGIHERLNQIMRGNAYRVKTHAGVAFGEVAALPARQDWTYGEQLAMSGGGLFATAWELAPWTWVVDAVYNLGKVIARFERAGIPVELKPTLRFGSWLSHKECESIFLPRYKALPYSYALAQPPNPNSGYGGQVRCIGAMVPRGYEAAFESNVKYSRYQLKGAFNELGMPTLRVPGMVTLGPLAAICAQSAAGRMLHK